ncbi:SRPBCC domain-containing protein [Nonomuraea sp. CA-141351]|uniref:SRPBCC domain-containing protein n=1 Tax=Nonomuraea sp. CA-141351 TaxID=3239996 RepID=UPI003D8E8AD7
MISITEEIAVPSPRARVWEVISNPADVVSCISGAELGAAHDDGSFDGTLVVKFGAVRVRFAARVTLELAADELEGRLSARGRDGQRATRFTAHATFRVVQGDGPGDARVAVSGEITINGKLAPLVESGAGAVATRMTREFSDQLVQRCAGLAFAEPEVTVAAATPGGTQRFAGLFGRLRAWWARLLKRRRPVSIPIRQSQEQSKEAGSGNAQAE